MRLQLKRVGDRRLQSIDWEEGEGRLQIGWGEGRLQIEWEREDDR